MLKPTIALDLLFYPLKWKIQVFGVNFLNAIINGQLEIWFKWTAYSLALVSTQ